MGQEAREGDEADCKLNEQANESTLFMLGRARCAQRDNKESAWVPREEPLGHVFWEESWNKFYGHGVNQRLLEPQRCVSIEHFHTSDSWELARSEVIINSDIGVAISSLLG